MSFLERILQCWHFVNLSEQQSYGPLISKEALPGGHIFNEMSISYKFCSSPRFPRLAGDPSWSIGNTPWQSPVSWLPLGPAGLQLETGNVRFRSKDFTFCSMGSVSGARTRSTLSLAGAFLMCISIHFRKAALGWCSVLNKPDRNNLISV